MPELPEVETTLRGIAPHIQHQIIKKIIIRHPTLRWPIPHEIHNATGKKIMDVQRRAKYLLLKTSNGIILIHLGMSGHLRIVTNNIAVKKHDHIDIVFHNNKILRFNDPRRFGAFLWITEDPEHHPLLNHLGVEPLTRNFSGKYLWQQAQQRTIPIKSFLMDHKIVTGIGNIYATEALFLAKIHPLSPAHSIALPKMQALVKSIKTILKRAIQQGGTTLRDFNNSDGKPGYFAQHLQVYGRAGLPCLICKSTLQSKIIAQRTTVYCNNCQKK